VKLAYTGLRSADRMLELGALNLVVGPVGSGKSSALDAVALAALGFVPRIGRDKDATSRLMAGSAVRATLSFDDGSYVVGGLRRDGDTLTSDGVTFDSRSPEAKPTEARKRILARFGRDQEEATQNVDMRTFFRGSPAERRQWVDRLLAPGVPALDLAVRLTVARLAFKGNAEEQEDRVPTDPTARLQLVGDRAAAFGAASSELALKLPEGIAAAIAWARDAANNAKADSKQKRAARGEIEERNLGVAKAGETQEALRQQRDDAVARRGAGADRLNAHLALTESRAQAEAALATARTSAAGAEESLARKRSAAAAIEGLRAALAAIVDPTDPAAPTPVPAPDCPEANAKDAEATKLRTEYETIRDPEPTPRVEPSTEIRARVEALKAEAATIVVPEVPSAYAAELAVTAAEREVKLAEQNPWREVEKIADELDGPGSCIGADDQADRLRALAVRNGGNAVALRAALARAKEALGQATLLRDGAQVEAENATAKRGQLLADAETLWRDECLRVLNANDAAQAAYGEAVKAVELRRRNVRARLDALAHEAGHIRRAAQAQVDDRNRAAADAHRRAVEANTQQRRQNAAERQKIEVEIEGLESAVRVAERIAAEARSSVAATEARLAGLAAATPLDVEAQRRELAALDESIKSLDLRIAALKAADACAAEMRALLAEIQRADAAAEVYGALHWALSRTAERDLRTRSGPILARMRSFLGAAGVEHEPYLTFSRDATDLGWLVDGQPRSCDGALSGGETVLLCAALASAVIALRAPEVRVLMIETAELHGQDASRLLRGCEAVRGDFHAVLIAGPEASAAQASAEWTVHRFAEEVAHAA